MRKPGIYQISLKKIPADLADFHRSNLRKSAL